VPALDNWIFCHWTFTMRILFFPLYSFLRRRVLYLSSLFYTSIFSQFSWLYTIYWGIARRSIGTGALSGLMMLRNDGCIGWGEMCFPELSACLLPFCRFTILRSTSFCHPHLLLELGYIPFQNPPDHSLMLSIGCFFTQKFTCYFFGNEMPKILHTYRTGNANCKSWYVYLDQRAKLSKKIDQSMGYIIIIIRKSWDFTCNSLVLIYFV
jgi:hypothetical protein